MTQQGNFPTSVIPVDTWSLSADYVGSLRKVERARYGGMLSVVWSDSDSAAGTVGFEISPDGVNWQPWTGLKSLDGTPVDIVNLSSGSDSQNWEVKVWTSPYFRVTYVANGTTAGTAKLYVHTGAL